MNDEHTQEYPFGVLDGEPTLVQVRTSFPFGSTRGLQSLRVLLLGATGAFVLCKVNGERVQPTDLPEWEAAELEQAVAWQLREAEAMAEAEAAKRALSRADPGAGAEP